MVTITRLQVPSGRTFVSSDISLLRESSDSGSIVYREMPFRLKSGIESHIYVFYRGDLTDNPKLLNMCGQKIVRDVKEYSLPDDHQPNLIGFPTAGTALATAASMASVAMGPAFPLISFRVMREVLKKSHGANDRWVNGEAKGPPDLQKFTFWTIDNVATDGKTKIDGAAQLGEDGYPSKEMPQYILIDRQQGAVKRLLAAGFERIVVGYHLLDITYLFRELRIWPANVLKLVEQEIAAHQFL